jgi:hypothetical protein
MASLLLSLIVMVKKVFLGRWEAGYAGLSASGADVDGLELAALDTLQQCLAGDAVGQGGLEHGQPAFGGVIDEQGA